jgi:alkylated DNA repair dioxygenase AlkB
LQPTEHFCFACRELFIAAGHRIRVTQQLLFASQNLPEGFVFEGDFISHEEENALISVIQSLDFAEFRMHGVTAKRRIVHFGLRYAFTSHHLTPAPDIPKEFESIRLRAAGMAGIEPCDFSETLVTEYRPGAGIGWHRDAPPFGIIAGISLASACRMRFQRGAGKLRETAAIELPPRSIYLFTGAARNHWQHSIPSTTTLRYSITFRTLREKS